MSNLKPSMIGLDKGLNLQVAKIVAPPGSILDTLNYEQVDFQGQKRIDGYTRYDGSHLSALDEYRVITFPEPEGEYDGWNVYDLIASDLGLFGVVVGTDEIDSKPVLYVAVTNETYLPIDGTQVYRIVEGEQQDAVSFETSVAGKDSGVTAEEHYNRLLELNDSLRSNVESLPGPVAGLHWFRDRLHAAAAVVYISLEGTTPTIYPGDVLELNGKGATVLDAVTLTGTRAVFLDSMYPEQWVTGMATREGEDVGELKTEFEALTISEIASIFEARSEEQVLREDTPGPYDFGWRFKHLGWKVLFNEGISLYGSIPAINQNIEGIGTLGPTSTEGNNGAPTVLNQGINITNAPAQVNGWKSLATPTSYNISPVDVQDLDTDAVYADAYITWNGVTRQVTGDTGVLIAYSPNATVYLGGAVGESTGEVGGSGGGGGGGTSGGKVFSVTGTLPNGYVGVPYRLDPNGGDPWTSVGGLQYDRVHGELVHGVGVARAAYGYKMFFGTPLIAETRNVDLTSETIGPTPETTGTLHTTSSVTIFPTPAFSLPDWGARALEAAYSLVNSDPPWTTVKLKGGACQMRSMHTAVSGDIHVEFTTTGTTQFLVGVTGRDYIAAFAENTLTAVLINGTYAVEISTATGEATIKNAAGDTIASGTLTGGEYRFGWAVGVGSVAGDTIKANYGNEPWDAALTAGFTGLPFGDPDITLMWDTGVAGANWMLEDGHDSDPYGIIRRANRYLAGQALLLGTFSKSSGKVAVGILGRIRHGNMYLGLVKDGYDMGNGLPGEAGADDSIAVRTSSIVEHYDLVTNFGGVTTVTSKSFFPISQISGFVFAVDFTAATVEVYSQDYDGNLDYWTTITGLPAGEWFPAATGDYDSFTQLYFNPPTVAGYNNWTF